MPQDRLSASIGAGKGLSDGNGKYLKYSSRGGRAGSFNSSALPWFSNRAREPHGRRANGSLGRATGTGNPRERTALCMLDKRRTAVIHIYAVCLWCMMYERRRVTSQMPVSVVSMSRRHHALTSPRLLLSHPIWPFILYYQLV